MLAYFSVRTVQTHNETQQALDDWLNHLYNGAHVTSQRNRHPADNPLFVISCWDPFLPNLCNWLPDYDSRLRIRHPSSATLYLAI